MYSPEFNGCFLDLYWTIPQRKPKADGAAIQFEATGLIHPSQAKTGATVHMKALFCQYWIAYKLLWIWE